MMAFMNNHARQTLSLLPLALLCCVTLSCESSSSSVGMEEVKVAEESAPGGTAQVQQKIVDEQVAKEEPPAEPVKKGLPVLDGDHFDVFDLLHNRPLAHRSVQDVLVIDAAQDDFLRYINGNYPDDWQLDMEIDGERAAAMKGSKITMWFPSVTDDGEHVLELQLHSAPSANTVSFELNGTKLEDQKLEQGWQTVSVKIPAGVVSAENVLEMKFSNMGRYDGKLGGAALKNLSVGKSAIDQEQKQSAQALVMSQDALSLTSQQGLAWYIWAQPEANLDLELTGKAGCGVKVDLWRGAQDGKIKRTVSKEIALVEGEGETQRTFFGLGEDGVKQGDVARVVLSALPSCGEDAIKVERASLVVPGKKPERPADVAPPKYILFWMVDTLRADHLPFYNDKTNVEAPAFAKLAEEGAIFKVAYVQGNESKVSHASLFTGLYPNRHRMLAKGKLKPEMEIMPEALKAAGYKTGAHVSNGYIAGWKGFEQGWNHFVNNLRENWRIDGASMAQHGIDWATKNKDNPFFLYIGTIDPHVTYRRHDEFIGKYDTTPYNGRYDKYCSGEDLGKIKGGGLKPNERDRERIQNLYKNEISYNDQAFAAIRQSFEEMGIWDETMVVITADHGDEFWEHGSVGHGHNVHQELVHVPLLMYYKPLIKAGTVVDAGVDVLDVYPTLVDMAGKERPSDLQGKSLVPLLLNQHGGYPQPAIATKYLGHYGMQMQHYKLYLQKGNYALYDRNADPLELENAREQNPLASRWLLDAMSWFRSNRSDWDKQSWGVPNNLSGDFLKLRQGDKS